MKTLIYAAISAVTLTIAGCSQKGNTGEIASLNLAEEIGTSVMDEISGKLKIERMFELEVTDSSLLGGAWCADILSDSALVVVDRNTIFRFSFNDGKYLGSFNKLGSNTADEYTRLRSASATPDNNVLVYDGNKRKILIYTPDGQFLSEKDVPAINDIVRDGDGYLTILPLGADKERKAVRYDSDMNQLATYSLGRELVDYNGMVVEYDFIRGASPMFMMNDTVVSINSDGPKALLTINRGELNPGANEFDMSKDSDGYICSLSPKIAGNYAFMLYRYNKKIYFDIWDIAEAKPVYRNIRDLGSPDGVFGMELQYEGQPVELWPQSVINGKLICVIDPDNMAEFKGIDEANPGIAVITIEE